ncbi:MAG: metallophosphoesterase [Roseococcus sp.]|nr:metallophosphoesterase [Roseococcus sp.]
MTRIAHLSDLHFGEADPEQALRLAADIRDHAPDAVAVSGDLTRRAETREFAASVAFLESLGAPLLVVPGNHDIPRYDLFARFLHPKRRWFTSRASGFQQHLELPGVRLIGLDTVSRAQWHLDWAAGAIPAHRRAPLGLALGQPTEGLTLLVCHHPLRHPSWAGARRAPRHAEATIALLRASGVAAVLCGHLHRAEMTRLGGTGPVQLVAPSGLSPRGSGRPNGWNLITVADGQMGVSLREWAQGAWSAGPLTVS